MQPLGDRLPTFVPLCKLKLANKSNVFLCDPFRAVTCFAYTLQRHKTSIFIVNLVHDLVSLVVNFFTTKFTKIFHKGHKKMTDI